MKPVLLFACGALIIIFSFCKNQDLQVNARQITGSEATIAWQDCAYFADFGITICFTGANEYRCPCNSICVWEGAVDAVFHVTTLSGFDQTITLTTNSYPVGLHNTATVDGKTIRFVKTATPTPTDCANYGKYEKYSAVISIE